MGGGKEGEEGERGKEFEGGEEGKENRGGGGEQQMKQKAMVPS